MVGSDPAIIPYKVIMRIFTTLYGMITESLPAYFSRAFYNESILNIQDNKHAFCKKYYKAGIGSDWYS